MSSADTNQASEADKAIMIGFLYGIQSDLLPEDEVVHRMVAFSHTKGYKEALAIIRTEKLKLLDNLERKSTHYTPDGLVADSLDPWAVSVSTINTVRNKLEAEL